MCHLQFQILFTLNYILLNILFFISFIINKLSLRIQFEFIQAFFFYISNK